jgi:hypothetical protein
MLDAFFFKKLFYLKILKFRSIVAPDLLHLELKTHFELSLGSALEYLGFLIYPTKRIPK